MATDLLNAYIKYKTKRAEIKQRQRQELERELEPLLKAVGDEIIVAQADGKRIEDIEFEIGARNRTLIYNAKRLSKRTEFTEPVQTPDAEEITADQRWATHYSDRYNEWMVFIDDKPVQRLIYDEEGELVIPDEWAVDTENQAMYREIIKYIKST